MSRRRAVSFRTLDEVMPDVERLMAGHTAVGQWSLGQICNHLALTIRLSIEGAPVKGSWLFRRVAGPVLRRIMLRRNSIPERVQVPKIYLPQDQKNAGSEAVALRKAIGRLLAYQGEFDEHPLLGRMSPVDWRQFHLIHCAHHLSFLWPASTE